MTCFNTVKGTSGMGWTRHVATLFVVALCVLGMQKSSAAQNPGQQPVERDHGGKFSWEIPGRVSIYDLEFGSAVLKDKEWKFLGNSRIFSTTSFKDRLTLMVRFSYKASKAEIPVKFIIKLPGSRQYEETVYLTNHQGHYTYKFTIHSPEDFVGNGSVYLYYGFSIVDVLDFTIMPGA